EKEGLAVTTTDIHLPESSLSGPEQRRRRRTTWMSPGARLLAVAFLAAAFGAAGAWLTPRGPITSGEALTTMGVALAVGGVVGYLGRTRWVFLIAPVAFVLAFELSRLSLVGPTVDAISVGSMYGWMVLILGRGVHGLLAIAPMLLGIFAGLWLARRSGHGSSLSFGWT